MSGLSPSLIPSHIFGLRSDIPDNIHFIDDGLVLYPAGHGLVLYNMETKAQRFIHGSKGGNLAAANRIVSEASGGGGGSGSSLSPALTRTEITAIAVSPNREFIAVAEKGERASILIYDVQTLKKKKILATSEAASKEYVSLAFSADSKYLLSQGGAPNFSLINWVWDQVKPLDNIRADVKVPHHSSYTVCSYQRHRHLANAPSYSVLLLVRIVE